MEAFTSTPPAWTEKAIHAREFSCPTCHSSPMKAKSVWINRRAPVYTEENRRKWQEFYHCHCGCAWWAWSADRPPSELGERIYLSNEDFL